MKKINLRAYSGKNQTGLAPISLVAVIVLVLALAGAVYFFISKGPSATKNEKALDELQVAAPQLDLSLSPMPQLKVSSFNVSVPDLPAANMFSGFSIDTDFSYSPAVNISAPAVQFSMPSVPQVQIPAAQPSSGAPGQQIPAEIPQQPSSQPSAEQQTQPQVDCSLFSAAPSCSYVGAPDSSAYEACKQCYPNK